MFPTCDLFFVAEMTAGTNLFVSVRMPRKFHTIGMVAQEIRSILLKLAVFQKVCVRKCTTDNSLKIQSQSPVRRVNVKKITVHYLLSKPVLWSRSVFGRFRLRGSGSDSGCKSDFQNDLSSFFLCLKTSTGRFVPTGFVKYSNRKKVLFQNCKI